jgi:hypothetical protein
VQFYGLGAVAALLSAAQATLEATVSMASSAVQLADGEHCIIDSDSLSADSVPRLSARRNDDAQVDVRAGRLQQCYGSRAHR